MIVGLLLGLLVIDIGLIFTLVRISRRQDQHHVLMRELTEERQMLSDLRSSIKDDLHVAQSQVKQMKDQVHILATEAEQEVKAGIQTITSEVETIINTLATRFDEPLNLLTSKQHYLENLLLRVQNERKQITQTTERAGAIARMLKQGTELSEVVDDIESKKLAEVRSLITRGLSSRQIASELGMSEAQVKLIQSASR